MQESGAPRAEAAGRYRRQTLFAPLGEEGQERLRAARVLVVGCGALGTHAAEHLARAGVGLLRLVDRDLVQLSNLHRQAGFTEEDARQGSPKPLALAAWLARVNSEVSLDPRPVDFHFTNALELAAGVDLMLDGSDNVPTRFLLNDVSLARGIPWIYAGVVGETGHAQLFLPGRGPCLRCLVPELPAPGELPTCDTAGVIGPAAGAIASLQAGLALRYLAQGEAAAAALASRQVRLLAWSLDARVSSVGRDPSCPACGGGGRLEHLEGRAGEEATVLCGRRTVQVRPAAAGRPVDLARLAARLRPLGEVEERRFLIRFRTGEAELVIFPDGRALVEGTDDPGRARALYARYVGQ